MKVMKVFHARESQILGFQLTDLNNTFLFVQSWLNAD